MNCTLLSDVTSILLSDVRQVSSAGARILFFTSIVQAKRYQFTITEPGILIVRRTPSIHRVILRGSLIQAHRFSASSVHGMHYQPEPYGVPTL